MVIRYILFSIKYYFIWHWLNNINKWISHIWLKIVVDRKDPKIIFALISENSLFQVLFNIDNFLKNVYFWFFFIFIATYVKYFNSKRNAIECNCFSKLVLKLNLHMYAHALKQLKQEHLPQSLACTIFCLHQSEEGGVIYQKNNLTEI